MQRQPKIKRIFKIAAFIVGIACTVFTVSSLSYKVYQYTRYKKVLNKIEADAKKRRAFQFMYFVKDPLNQHYILLSPYTNYQGKNSGEMVIMDFAGHVLVNKKINHRVNNLRQWKIDGQTLYTCGIDDTDNINFNGKIGSSNYIAVLDSLLNETSQIRIPLNEFAGSARQLYLDSHDFLLLSPNHYIITCNFVKTEDNIPTFLSPKPGTKVVAQTILEINAGKVTWRWEGDKYPEFYQNSTDGNKFYDTTKVQDYMHINSLCIDPGDSNLIVSMRNTDQVVKLDRHNGAIVWRLGGRNSDFPLKANEVFLRQHHVTLTDSYTTLLLFDNGEQSARPQSRILEIKLDEKSKTVASFKGYNIPEKFSAYRGSVQKVGSDYFICGGYTPYLLLANCATGAVKMRMHYNQSLYRAYIVDAVPGISLKQ
jgi:arylsulfate sulfotransferase